MNKKLFWFVPCAMIGIGAGMLITGLILGAKPVVKAGYDEMGKNGEITSGTVALKDFDSLEVNVASVNTYIEEGDEYKLEYKAYEKNVPVVKEKGGKLTVEQPASKVFFGINLSFIREEEDQYYKITVPKNAGEINLDFDAASGKIAVSDVNVKGKIELASGKAELNNINSKELILRASSGRMDLNKVELSKLDVEVLSGKLVSENCVTDELVADMSSGSMDFDKIKFNKGDFKVSSGSLKVNVLGKEDDYSYDVEASSGSIKIGDKKVGDEYRIEKSGDKEIKADVSSGSIKFSFGE